MQSQSVSALYAALVEFQAKDHNATKNATNSHLKNKYADLPAVLEAIQKPMAECGLGFLQMPVLSDPGTLQLVTRIIHKSGEWIESAIVMPLAQNTPQGYGSAMTYARRYALTAMLGVAQEDDDGEAATRPQANTTRQQSNQRQAPQRQEQEEDPPPPPPAAKMATKAQIDAIGNLVAKLGWDAAKSATFLKENFSKATRADLTSAEASKAIDLLSKMRSAEPEGPSSDEIAKAASAAL